MPLSARTNPRRSARSNWPAQAESRSSKRRKPELGRFAAARNRRGHSRKGETRNLVHDPIHSENFRAQKPLHTRTKLQEREQIAAIHADRNEGRY